MKKGFSFLAIKISAMPRIAKRIFIFSVDLALCVFSVSMAFYLRLGDWVPFSGSVQLAVTVSVIIALPVFIKSGLYRTIFRYSGLPAMLSLARAMLLYSIIFSSIFTFWGVDGVPRTIGLIQPILLFLLIGASRAVLRVWLESLYRQQVRKVGMPQALIYGAGKAGQQLASAMASSSEINVVGFLDDDNRLHGHLLNGLLIHNPAELDEILIDLSITDVLLALPSVSHSRRNKILNTLKFHKVAVRTLPGLSDIATGKISLSDVRELDIDDLLGREPVQPNDLLLNLNNHDKTVLLTGAGGSIGSELCRQILKTKPKKILLVEISEFALYQIHKELLAEVLALQIEVIPLLASVCDEIRMNKIIKTWKPHTIYHAAAYKHVPLVEHNPIEGVRNNVWGTLVCAKAAIDNGVRNFVLVSTDKAVRPTNIMGATKRLAEMVLQALSEVNIQRVVETSTTSTARTNFSMVRFGNVLGSSGSVVPLFREQIKNGGPVTLTHPEITRYFMTIPEAAQLVIQAGAMSHGGDVFVLDMGQPVKIIHLARRMIELSGLTVRDQQNPDGDIELVITGLRPGEKLYEELLIGDNPELTDHPRIMKAHEQFLDWTLLEDKLSELNVALKANNLSEIQLILRTLVSGYTPTSKLVDWVHLALDDDIDTNKC